MRSGAPWAAPSSVARHAQLKREPPSQGKTQHGQVSSPTNKSLPGQHAPALVAAAASAPHQPTSPPCPGPRRQAAQPARPAHLRVEPSAQRGLGHTCIPAVLVHTMLAAANGPAAPPRPALLCCVAGRYKSEVCQDFGVLPPPRVNALRAPAGQRCELCERRYVFMSGRLGQGALGCLASVLYGGIPAEESGELVRWKGRVYWTASEIVQHAPGRPAAAAAIAPVGGMLRQACES